MANDLSNLTLRFGITYFIFWSGLTDEFHDPLTEDSPHIRIFYDFLLRKTQIKSELVQLHIDDHFGNLVNGTFDGHYGQLENEEFDLYLVPAHLTEDISERFDFSAPIGYLKWIITSTISIERGSDVFVVTSIFSFDVWMFFLAFLLLFPMVAVCIEERKILRVTRRTFFCSFYSALSRVFNQSIGEIRNVLPSRILWMSWILACFVLTAAFSGVLLSKITIRDVPFQVHTLTDMLFLPNVEIWALKSSPLLKILRESSDQKIMKLRDQIAKRRSYRQTTIDNAVEGFEKTVTGQAVSVVNDQLLFQTYQEYGLYRDSNEAYVSKEHLLEAPTFLIMSKRLNSRISRAIKDALLSYVETGLMKRSMDKKTFSGRMVLETLSKGSKSERYTPEALFLKSFYLPLLTFAFLIFASKILFFLDAFRYFSSK